MPSCAQVSDNTISQPGQPLVISVDTFIETQSLPAPPWWKIKSYELLETCNLETLKRLLHFGLCSLDSDKLLEGLYDAPHPL